MVTINIPYWLEMVSYIVACLLWVKYWSIHLYTHLYNAQYHVISTRFLKRYLTAMGFKWIGSVTAVLGTIWLIFIKSNVTRYRQQKSIIIRRHSHEAHNFAFAICKMTTTEPNVICSFQQMIIIINIGNHESYNFTVAFCIMITTNLYN